MIADVTVWSSMRKSTTELVVRYLFRGIQLPSLVLGQDSCETLKCRDRHGRVSSFKVPGTDKDLFLKNLVKLFTGYGGRFTSANTIVVDDSPIKHILNEPQNVILPDSWSYVGDGASDNFLHDVLLPWFRRLHRSPGPRLSSFRMNDNIGRRMLCDEPDRRQYSALIDAVHASRSLPRS
jgi:hypothetical protein